MKGTRRLEWSELRKLAREQLEENLELLRIYCQDPDSLARELAKDHPDLPPLPELMKGFYWPPRELLKSLEESVVLLIATERTKKPSPRWKAFILLDKRMPSLRLVLRVNNLVNRAISRLKNAGESVLSKAARDTGSVAAQNLLRDLVLQKQNLGDLLKDHDERNRVRLESKPLMLWLSKIGHPYVRDLVVFRHAPASMARFYEMLSENLKMRWQREKARDRDRRYRLRKKALLEKRRPTTR
jgi:hypothetical protein